MKIVKKSLGASLMFLMYIFENIIIASMLLVIWLLHLMYKLSRMLGFIMKKILLSTISLFEILLFIISYIIIHVSYLISTLLKSKK